MLQRVVDGVVGGVLAVWVGLGAQRPALTVADLLMRAGAYLAEYETKFSAVVSEEHYLQSSDRGREVTTARLLSDVIILIVAQDEWIAFRDVFKVNGSSVRDHDKRLEQLFLQSPSGAMAEAQRIMNESARYNVGTLRRNINVPTMALTYLRGPNQARSVFRRDGTDVVDGISAAVLAFKEQLKPTVIRSATRDLPATGRFWIDETSGRVLKSELDVRAESSAVKIVVTYGPAPNVDLWAPVSMKENYATTAGERIAGQATYSNFRQFVVTVK
jgi:hypothetical protein